jgi:hypothetical protein
MDCVCLSDSECLETTPTLASARAVYVVESVSTLRFACHVTHVVDAAGKLIAFRCSGPYCCTCTAYAAAAAWGLRWAAPADGRSVKLPHMGWMSAKESIALTATSGPSPLYPAASEQGIQVSMRLCPLLLTLCSSAAAGEVGMFVTLSTLAAVSGVRAWTAVYQRHSADAGLLGAA